MEFLIVLITLFIIELCYFRVADKFNIIDKPNERSSHSQITLRGGGIIFYIAAVIYFFKSGFQYPYFFLGLTLISMISFLDDVLTLSSKVRSLVQLLAVGLMLYNLDVLTWPWWTIPITLVLSVGTINAYNFMDGINGITVANSLAVLGLLAYVNLSVSFIDSSLIYYTILGCLVFAFFNFRTKAKCFAGDVGSVSMAFIIIFLITKLIVQTGNPIYILFLLIYGVDSVLTIVRRLLKKENIFEAHRSHLYQILANEHGSNRLVISSIYGLLQVFIGFFIIYATKFSFKIQMICAVAAMCVVGIVYLFIKSVLIKKYNIQ